jgi:hypothetical protein
MTCALSCYSCKGLTKPIKTPSLHSLLLNLDLNLNLDQMHSCVHSLVPCNFITLSLLVHTALHSGKFMKLKYVISSILTYLWLYQGVLRSATYTWQPHVFPLMSSSSVVVVKATIFWLETEQRVWPSCKLKWKQWHMRKYTKCQHYMMLTYFSYHSKKYFSDILSSDNGDESLVSDRRVSWGGQLLF